MEVGSSAFRATPDLSFEENKEIKQGGSYTTIPTKNIISIKKIKL